MNPTRPPIVWTPQKLQQLREHFPTMFNFALAKWMGCSERTLERKARELGLRKVDNFNQVRKDDISELLSVAVKKAYTEGRKTATCRKGERFNPDGEFKPGHRFDGEIETARIEKIRRTYRKQKLLKIYGLVK